MKKLLAIAAIGLFAASTALAGSGCDGMGLADGDYSAPVTTVLDSGTTKPNPKPGS